MKKNSIKYLIPKVGNILYECLILNMKNIHVEYENKVTSEEVLFEMSKSFPRKRKKLVRKLIK